MLIRYKGGGWSNTVLALRRAHIVLKEGGVLDVSEIIGR